VSIRLAIEHRTVYGYDRPVRLGPHVMRLRPAPHCRTPILAYSLKVMPGDHFINWQQDPFGNYLARLVFPEPTLDLAIKVGLVVDMTVINPFDFFLDEDARAWPFRYDAALAHDLAPYLVADDPGPAVSDWLAEIPGDETPTIDFLVALNGNILRDVAYSVRMEHGVQSPEQTLSSGVGSCRDSAWLLVGVLRRLGIAARFVSGYLVQLAADAPAAEGPAGPAVDYADLHAWAEAYVPGAGWIGLDPTSGLLTGEGHIPLACTSTPAGAAPVAGAVEPCETKFEFSNNVRRIHEDPRVTLPYTTEQWERIDALGRLVDADLDAGDARLTMGGEPTFVAGEDMQAPEWNTAADGPTKRRLATALTLGLATRLAPGALIQHTQGKWYPGEPLPRWQIDVHWRTDGHPVWRNPALLADPTEPGACSEEDVATLGRVIAHAFGLASDVLVPAYEDLLGRLWTESRLPDGDPPVGAPTEPPDPALADAATRAEIVATLDAERGVPRGWALPLHRAAGQHGWSTGRWALRRGHLFLIAGDSPMGMRMPLDSIAWKPPPPEPERSLFATVGELPAAPAADAALDADPPPITALCVELRDGNAHVFLPPLVDAGHALELIAVVEDAAASLELPVVVEGYPPVSDTRLRHFMVAPDPGVIEVNIHPSGDWPDIVETTTVMYEEARRIGLAAEKFALDGTHTGTGGGSHLTLGGPTPRDSPLLRRPDLLRSLVTYWQHHPSLSYLFAGRFVGPTSQAPRVDEARHDSLYELETAFAELDRLTAKGDGEVAPWQVDRLLRNLLVDLTGNTHRAEFCIDKLFSAESEHGRLGVVELRGFEMPPHPQMALVQALLVRALVAMFWAEPYAAGLVRWGTELHDRFLLPWWLHSDIRSVARDLIRHGYPFDASWLHPFFEFRFPRLGSFVVQDMSVELRMAIEPWNVLAEDLASGASRFVDSSVERLQVRVDGLTESRYAVTCNGSNVPLTATDTPGTYVAGVRYKAWRLSSSLHPTIEVHSPLVFDVVDVWSSRSIGGCTYYVSHPGGRAYDRFPANASEAEARRASRFAPSGHTPGRIEVAAAGRTGEFPRTLDLRR
jgi:uncharacterized protein (DUF2126 family)/transglutaminase-like putative cysteine protease